MRIPKSKVGKVHLSKKECELPTPQLRALLTERGIVVSKSTLSRVKTGKQTWILIGFKRGGAGRRANIGYVWLTDEEKGMYPRFLAQHLGVSWETARAALNRGWFEVTTSNEKKLDIDKSRIIRGDLPT